jgi:hypothetical protein
MCVALFDRYQMARVLTGWPVQHMQPLLHVNCVYLVDYVVFGSAVEVCLCCWHLG